MNIFYSLLANLNYTTIFILMMVESTVIPFPSEVVVPPAAYQAAAGNLNIWLVLLFATLGAVVGAIINYAAGYYLGRPVIHRFANAVWAGSACSARRRWRKARSTSTTMVPLLLSRVGWCLAYDSLSQCLQASQR